MYNCQRLLFVQKLAAPTHVQKNQRLLNFYKKKSNLKYKKSQFTLLVKTKNKLLLNARFTQHLTNKQ